MRFDCVRIFVYNELKGPSAGESPGSTESALIGQEHRLSQSAWTQSLGACGGSRLLPRGQDLDSDA